MTKKTRVPQKSRRRSHRSRNGNKKGLSAERVMIGGSVLVSIVIVVVILLNNASSQLSVTSGLPTPIGFPQSAQDVGTMVGQVAPDFTLPDETGQLVTVNFDEAERPTVIIFNMGLG